MTCFRVLVIAALLVLTLGGVAAAQKVNPTVDMSSSGQTIGGPGGVSNSTGGQAVFFQSVQNTKGCVTVSNFGAPVAVLINGTQVGPTVGTLQTVAVCDDDFTSAGATCETGASCKFIWRVDGKF